MNVEAIEGIEGICHLITLDKSDHSIAAAAEM